MFSGIVEACAPVLSAHRRADVVELIVKKPSEFDDLSVGASVATNGVCLTVEEFGEDSIQFAVAAETLHVTGWNEKDLKGQKVNLERSLRFGDRVHGHMVTGHVDAVGRVQELRDDEQTRFLRISFPSELKPYFWKKGSLAINGVSLTINEVGDFFVEVYLIPETLKRTNLGLLGKDDRVNLEVDSVARGLIHWLKTEGKSHWN